MTDEIKLKPIPKIPPDFDTWFRREITDNITDFPEVYQSRREEWDAARAYQKAIDDGLIKEGEKREQ